MAGSERPDRHAGGRQAKRRGAALCLSGGGFRAAIFHLGAMLRLQQAGRLAQVQAISAVSGGSIAAAWLACRYLDLRHEGEAFADWCSRCDFRAEVVEPFREIAARDLRTWPVLLTWPWNWLWPSTRVSMLQRRLDAIFGGRELRDLPPTPHFVLCATDLTFGVNWEFSRRRCGDFQAGYLRRHGKIRLATAVAASACFPPLFGPMRLDLKAEDFLRGRHRGEFADHLRDRIELSDGGVYDNLATEPVIKSASVILVSDAGAPFPFVAGGNVVRRLLRHASVIGNQAVALRKRLLFRGLREGEHAGAYWSLEERDPGAPGYSPGLARDVLARVRTDLDGFDDAEFEALVNHGYFACLAATEPGLDGPWPYPARSDESRVRRDLRGSHRRFWPPRWWQNRSR